MGLGKYNLLKDNRNPILRAGDGDRLKLWTDGANTLSIADTADSVTQLNDLSGDTNNLTQGTASRQPTTNTTTQNGRNIIDFDGGDDLIMPSALFSIPNGPNTSIFVTKRTAEDASTDTVMGMATGTRNDWFLIFASTAGMFTFKNRAAVGGTVSSSGHTNTDMNIVVCRRLGTEIAISVNGEAEITSATGVDVAGIDDAFMGRSGAGTLNLNGSIAECALYDASLSQSYIVPIIKDLSAKWGVSLVI